MTRAVRGAAFIKAYGKVTVVIQDEVRANRGVDVISQVNPAARLSVDALNVA